ncbi:MAG TPA: rhodanese-like domain-containing protein [Thermoanaerobaculia bacterium]|jgi:hypothetical protein
MVKRVRQETNPASSRNTILVLAAGVIVIVGLVAWALTRTVEQPLPTANAPVANAPANAPASATTGSIPPASAADLGDKGSVPRISAEDLVAKNNRGEVTVIDVRDANSYATGHIPGAIHIPLASVEAQLAAIPKGKPIVTYCT